MQSILWETIVRSLGGVMVGGCALRSWFGAATAVVATACVTSAHAGELVTPILPAVTVGIPSGAASPPGIYYGNWGVAWQSRIVDANGKPTPVRINIYATINALYVVPGIEILGGQYSFTIAKPITYQPHNVFGVRDAEFGGFNTYFQPFNLSYRLADGLFASWGLAVLFPDARYTPNRYKVSTGNAFSSFEPSFAVSYLKDGWNLTANFQVAFNATNEINQYLSGSLYGIDFTATKTFGKWTVGLQGFYLNQFEPDRIAGNVIPATIYNGRGNKLIQSGAGPYISYDFGSFTLSAWYDQNIYTRNYTAANIAWLKIAVPLGNPFTPTTPVTPSALPVRNAAASSRAL